MTEHVQEVPEGKTHALDGSWETTPFYRQFSDAVAADHWRFDRSEYDDIYVVGDVHGCLDELERLWEKLAPTEQDLVLFVGDLVRKGPASVDVVEFVHGRDNAVSVRGNNEAKLLQGQVDTTPFEPVLETVAAMPLVVSFDDAMVVHGGIDPTKPPANHTPGDLLEMRAVPPGNGYDGPFWFDRYDGPVQVCFGHTVLEEPLVEDSVAGLDTGCVYGGELTAYDYDRGELYSVPAERAYQSRADDKILTP